MSGETETIGEGGAAGNVESILGELLLTRAEVARILRVSKDTVLNLHRTKQLAGVLVGKHLRWRPADVREFVERLKCGH